MITLDANITLNSSSPSFLHLLSKLRRRYGSSAESVNTNEQAGKTNGTEQTNNCEQTDQVGNVTVADNLDFAQLIEDLRLNVSENRFALLLLLPRSELFEMLQLLGKDQLLNGLKFFSKEKLMALIGGLPKEDLLKMLFTMFTNPNQLIENLPTKELYHFLRSDKIDKGQFMKTFELMPKENLSTIAGYLTKKNCDKMDKRELLHTIKQFEKFHLVDGMRKLDEKSLRNFVTTLTESNPKLYSEFSHLALFNVADRFARTDLIESMMNIDDSKIMNMLSELPDKLLALTVSQIDPQVFAALLLNNYQDLLTDLVTG